MKRSGCLLLVLCSVLSFANGLQTQDDAQHIPAAVISDPPPDPVHPATMASPDIPSHGAKMYAVLYIAAGEGPHPTVLMLHGFPGNEKNLGPAYSIRRAGWFTIRGATTPQTLTLTVSGAGTGSGEIHGTMVFDRKDCGMNKGIA
ncbi:MAG TPA: YceI family protein [Terriglobales bacterium]